MNEKWKPSLFRDYHKHEHDACGIVSSIQKENRPTNDNIQRVIDALVTMNHRAGFVNEEGDGVGIHIDIPRKLWEMKLNLANQNRALAYDPQFAVGHIMINHTHDSANIQSTIRNTIQDQQLSIIYETNEVTNSEALGPIAKKEEPIFWQFALLPEQPMENLEQVLFNLTIEIEKNENVHVASLSSHHVVYKMMGAADQLQEYYVDLKSPNMASSMTLGHNRYSTNTKTNFFRVQPFSVLGHNGEINTIAKLRDEAEMVGVPLTNGGSDSQDVNRTLDTFINKHNLSLFEALDIMFPPIVNEINRYPEHLQDMYTYIREAWGHFAQGPAGIISRYRDEAAFSLDSLGLRPLWQLETEDAYLFSSEPGIMPNEQYVNEPKPLSPGEKVGVKYDEDGLLQLFDHFQYQETVFNRLKKRLSFEEFNTRLQPQKLAESNPHPTIQNVHNGWYSANGWDREQVQLLEQMAEKGAEPIRSLGHDVPLAALQNGRKNIADYLKESVAVVTNPAIDRDREAEHFSTRTVLGKRPSLFGHDEAPLTLELSSPILVEGIRALSVRKAEQQPSYEQVLDYFRNEDKLVELSMTCKDDESVDQALNRIAISAEEAVAEGKELVVLDDRLAHQEGHLWLDPHLVVSKLDQHLREHHLRRSSSIILKSAAIRSLHDIITVYGLGADAINPYLMFATVASDEDDPTFNLYNAINKGLEKVISTIGIHELRGYARLFSSIGLYEPFADILRIVNFLGAETVTYNWDALKEDAEKRRLDFHDEKAKPTRSFHVLPRIWKAIGDIARGGSYDPLEEKLTKIEEDNPISIRHLTSFKSSGKGKEASDVNITMGEHDLPFIISSMSFGSQNETAFRSYAEAADRLNMISINGEGGEIKDMLGKYPKTRGQQIASGRFGVNAELLNSSNLLEIKIGQGAKPGEGGHLPGSKVTEKIAEARNATVGSDLISPSNNHDIYSIEDLAQMISELKTANDEAKVAVKVPIVPNIGTIAVGIAKAGADYINLSGFDGGTGAARVHALQHVGLPAEIGVKAAHNALMEAGLRHKVEIWCDGGLRSVKDVLKVVLLGANRVGFGTLSMIAVGCTACRGCHLDTCHVGIATQIDSEAQAKDHGLRRFVPRQYEPSVSGLVNLFQAFGKELQQLIADLGYSSLQEVVGRSDLLEQSTGKECMDLTPLLTPLEVEEMDAYRVQEAQQERKLAVAVGAENYLDEDEQTLLHSRTFSAVTSSQRNLGSRVSCARVRGRLDGSYQTMEPTLLHYKQGSIVGNGFGAYITEGIQSTVNGGAQDGVGKTAYGGKLFITKSKGKNKTFINGSVGKGFGYGAQKGTLLVQGQADSRAGIRLSGADLIIGQQLKSPINAQHDGNIGCYASIKGFAFEYMTNGRGLVLGDPGPWICAGMTGGVVYLRHQPEMGLTEEALQKRIAKGAKVSIEPLNETGHKDVEELLSIYIEQLKESDQAEEAQELEALLQDLNKHFLQVVPEKIQADPSISTE
ncbi:glutamate synthase-related protein [Salirhabdus salicampi]|uniref:glutamate synthase-related protein n=1 Tax=Salirhabdus salicampi TaxID=476102 RepID=UPI0020C23B2D|nr:glutamate synthase-related protein [Salirhabdus salicampi]MCP8617972.1 glutamate synthase-related protein [Salirhabdus salicampi]